MSFRTDAKHWQYRASEARSMARKMTDPEALRIMLQAADAYDKLADRYGHTDDERFKSTYRLH